MRAPYVRFRVRAPDPARRATAQDIVTTLAEDIAAGRLPPGARLPPVRVLEQQLGLSKNTVQVAYDELVARGLLDAREREGVFVASRSPDAPAIPPVAQAAGAPPAARPAHDGAIPPGRDPPLVDLRRSRASAARAPRRVRPRGPARPWPRDVLRGPGLQSRCAEIIAERLRGARDGRRAGVERARHHRIAAGARRRRPDARRPARRRRIAGLLGREAPLREPRPRDDGPPSRSLRGRPARGVGEAPRVGAAGASSTRSRATRTPQATPTPRTSSRRSSGCPSASASPSPRTTGARICSREASTARCYEPSAAPT